MSCLWFVGILTILTIYIYRVLYDEETEATADDKDLMWDLYFETGGCHHYIFQKYIHPQTMSHYISSVLI